MNVKSLYLFFISFIFLIAAIIIDRYNFNKMKHYTEEVSHTRNVIISFGRLSDHFKSAQIYSPDSKSDEEKNFNSVYKREAESIVPDLDRLRKLVGDNPVQVKRVDTLSVQMKNQLRVLINKNITRIIAENETWRIGYLYDINEIINRGIDHENKLLAERTQQLENSTSLTSTLTTVFSVSAGVLIISTFISIVVLSRKRQWLEGFLESILNTSQNGIVTYRAIRKNGKIVDFRIQYANAAVEKLLGIKPASIIGKRYIEIQSDVIETDMFARYASVVDTGGQVEFESEYRLGDRNRSFNVILAKMEDGLTATFHDISDLKKYQDELKNNITQLEYSNSELEQYAYVASHDLQEPLRKIRTFGSMLEQQSVHLDEVSRGYIQKMLGAAERMTNLIKDILSFSSLKREQAIEVTNLNEVLSNVVSDLDLSITQKGAVVKQEKLPLIEAIPLQMHQLFFNLITNALKFAKDGTVPVITITATLLTKEEVLEYSVLDAQLPYCSIVVRDNGIGFEDEFSDQIFGLFKRLNDRNSYSGSGIGLALCRKVVSNHNGLILAKGKSGEGAAFHIILPVKQAA